MNLPRKKRIQACMIKNALTIVVVVGSLATFVNGTAFAAPDVQQEDPGAFELLTTVLQDAYLKGLLPDSFNEQLTDLLIDELIVPDTGETSEQTRKRLSLGVDTWEAPFDFLLITIEEAYSSEVLSDRLSELLSAWLVDGLIAPASGETGDEVRERLRDKLASAPMYMSDSYGTLANPVPFRETAMTGNGLAIKVVASNLDATEIVQSWSELNAPPEPGNKYVIARVRLQEGDSSLIQSFGLVASSGRIIRSDSPYKPCEWMPSGDSHDIWYEVFHLEAGQTLEGVLCFQAPIEEKSLSIFREVHTHWFPPAVTGFWAMSDDSTGAEPRPAPSPVSDNYGTLYDPVPLGQSALAPNGVAITVVSADPGHGPPEGNKRVTVRVRVESVTKPEDDRFRSHGVRAEHFGIVASSGRMISGSYYRRCNRDPDALVHSDLFEGGWIEVALCFEMPSEETGFTLYYESRMSYSDTRVNFWNISSVAPPSPPQPPAAISDTYGTLASPVPVGESALASDGIAITVLYAEPSVNTWQAKVLAMRVRLEYFGGAGLRTLGTDSFGLVNSAGLITYGHRYCGYSDLEAETFEGGWQEDDLCFRGTFDTDGLVFFYLPEGTDRVLGFWEVSSEFSDRPNEVPPTPISGAYGTLDSPVPTGEKASASDGVAITVTSAMIDGALLGYESTDEHTSVLVRARVEGFGQDPNQILEVDEGDFGIAGVSGILSMEEVKSRCSWDERLEVRVFNGGRQEGNLCFNVPVAEAERMRVYYQPESSDGPLGFWEISSKSGETGVPAISDTYGTLQAPVLLGETALAAGGLAISVLSVDTDAELPHGRLADPGNKYVTIRALVENLTGFTGNVKVSERDFGLVTHSGRIIYEVDQYHVYQCGAVPDELEGEITDTEISEGNLCFQVPVGETEGLSLYYSRGYPGRILGFWSLSADAPPYSPAEPATPISGSYGTRANPVPLNEKAMASDGHAITVLSVNLDARYDEHRHYSHTAPSPAPEGSRYVVIRVRLANHTIAENTRSRSDWDHYGMITGSGLVRYGHNGNCPYTRYSIYRNVIFRGGFTEGDLCFVIPEEETGLTLFYRPQDSTLGFWNVYDSQSGDRSPGTAPKSISDTYGTWMKPVPFREAGLASNGIAIRVADAPEPARAIEDYGGPLGDFHIRTVGDSDDLSPRPYPGYEYFVVRVFAENRSGDPNELVTVSHRDFGLITTSSRRVTYSKDYGCISKPRAPTSDLIETYYFPGQLGKAYLFRDTWIEANLCFQIPAGETVQSVFYRPWTGEEHSYNPESQKDPALGFWAVSEDGPTYAPSEPGTPISETYGRLESAVPVGEKAVASNEIAVSILSANLNADEAIQEAWDGNPVPEPGKKYILVRVRVESTSDKWNEMEHVRDRDFGVSISSGLLRDIRDPYRPNHAMCAWVSVPDAFGASLFGGMSGEGNMCFQIPIEESAQTVFYLPFSSVADEPDLPSQIEPYDPAILDPYVLGYWALPTE